jgi:hypothetical protein
VKIANSFAKAEAIFYITGSVLLIIAWATSAAMFHKRVAPAFNVPNIWSWSCNHKDATVTPVDFHQICLTQVLLPYRLINH